MSKNKSSVPIVSVAMFVFNGEETLAAAIDSILNQTFTDFELIISDNASTDKTEKICKSYAREDERIRYIRQSVNIGAGKNFQFVFEQSIGEFIMFAADDDTRTAGFIEKNLEVLTQNSTIACSSSPSFLDTDIAFPERAQTFSLHGSLYDRIRGFLDNKWISHGCFYGLIRRRALEDCRCIGREYPGTDWSVNIHILSKGAFARISEEKLVFGTNGLSMQPEFLASLYSRPLHHVFPMYEFSIDLIEMIHANGELDVMQRLAVYMQLVSINALVQKDRFSVRMKQFIGPDLMSRIKQLLGRESPADNV